MKKLLIVAASLSALLLAGCSDKEVASVSLGVFTFKDIKLDAFTDPQVPGVTCHVAYINSPLQLSDPSNSSVSCVKTGEITQAMIDGIDKSADGEVVFKKSQSQRAFPDVPAAASSSRMWSSMKRGWTSIRSRRPFIIFPMPMS